MLLNILKSHAQEIQAGAAMLGVVVGALGFGLTICQLNITQNTLKASNGYQIQKDARSISSQINKGGLLATAISGGKLNAEEEKQLTGELWEMFNLYLSVYRQEEARGVSEELAKSFSKDFCEFSEIPFISHSWKLMLKSRQLSSSHAEMKKEWCDA